MVLLADWIVALAWAGRTVYWIRGLRRVPDLTRDVFKPIVQTSTALTVIVPACNEEKAVAACLRSLLASTGVRLDIIAVDDRSTDATGRLMDEVAAEAPGTGHAFRVLHIDALPEGWMGKTHAMARAAAEAVGDWMLFTDGDMLFAPDALARVLAYGEAERADHIVLYPTMIFHGFGERMMISFLHAMSIWAIRPWRVGDPNAPNDFIGIGAFNLIRRPVYDAVGGWSALRLEVLEDLRMGFTINRAGYRQRAVFGRDLTCIRWAEGAYGAVTNMTKNLFALFRFRLAFACVGFCGLLLLCILPFASLALGPAGVAPCLLVLGSLGVLYARYQRLGLPNLAYSATFPLGSLLFLYALVRSIIATLGRGGVTWRGTFYSLKELRKHAGPLR